MLNRRTIQYHCLISTGSLLLIVFFILVSKSFSCFIKKYIIVGYITIRSSRNLIPINQLKPSEAPAFQFINDDETTCQEVT